MTTARKGLATMVVIGVTGALAAFGTFSAFSANTTNDGNSFTAGTVTLTNNSATAMFNGVTGAAPGATPTERCIKVAYTGSLAATVKLYLPDAVGALAPYVDMKVTAGTDASPSFGDCTGFVADGAPIFNNTLAAFRAAHTGWANGLAYNPGGDSKWDLNDAVTYRVELTLQDNNAAQGLGTGTHRLMWEARNQ